MNALSFSLLGPAAVTGADGEIVVNGELRRRLLVRLLVAPNRPVPTGRLQEDLWEGEPPASAASTLKSHVSLLRRSLGPERLVHQDGAYRLLVAPGELDVALFEAEAATGRGRLREGDAAGAAEVLGRSLARWRGPALAEVAHTSWAGAEAVRLEELRVDVLESWLEARLALGETSEVVLDAELAIAEHPLREALWGQLMRGLYLGGRQADALRAYQRLRSLLGDELGIVPSPELSLLEGAILRQELVRAPARSEVDGAWRPARGGNLPPELTTFIPRPEQSSALARLLERPGLVTLTGPGGTGKTRLALQAGRQLAAGFDSVWMCELGSIDGPADVMRELAAAIGCAGHVGIDLAEAVCRRLAEGTQLVILDNCEHLVADVAQLADRLLRRLDRLHILATSRSPLGVESEIIQRVPSMSVPTGDTDPTRLLEFESVRLLVARAESQQPGFTLGPHNSTAVATVCLRLDGIPLALELAAARLRTMSMADIERRLDDRFALLTGGARTSPARQQTLRALIDWSYELLEDGERAALRSLSVFQGDFDLAAAESVVAGDGIAQPAVLDLVASLVDKSLLQLDMTGGAGRYRMLETVREYAGAKLDEHESLRVRLAHAMHFLGVVESAAPHFSGAEQLLWRERLEHDEDNLRAAFDTLVSAGDDAEPAHRFGAAVSRYWNCRGYYGDEVALLETALRRPRSGEPTAALGAALSAAGYLMFRRGETAEAQRYLDEAVEIARAHNSVALEADPLRTLAWVADRRGDRDGAAALAEAAFEAAKASGQSHLIARAFDVRAAMCQHVDPIRARSDYQQVLRYCRASGDGLGQASALNNLGVLELEQGDHQAARSHFKQALGLAEGVRDAALVPFLEYGLGLAAYLDDDGGAAEEAFLSALRAASRTGQHSLVAYSLLGLAGVRAAEGASDEAARLLGASSGLFEQLGELPERIEGALRERLASELAASLGDAMERALEEGRLVPRGDLVGFALATCGM